jgi:hypothetical protein
MVALPQIVVNGGSFLVTLLSFWVYFDGVEKLSSLESNLWAVSVLILGISGFVIGSLGIVVLGVFVALLYVFRTRLV